MNGFLPADDEVARRLAATRAAVMEATRHVRSPKHSTRYRVTRNAIIAGVAVAVLTAGTIAVVQAAQSTISTNVVCFEQPDPDSAHINAATRDDMFDPVEMCQTVWALDLFHDTLSEDDTHPVPDLAACTMPDGVAGVFPLGEARPEDFCAALGLADWDSD